MIDDPFSLRTQYFYRSLLRKNGGNFPSLWFPRINHSDVFSNPNWGEYWKQYYLHAAEICQVADQVLNEDIHPE